MCVLFVFILQLYRVICSDVVLVRLLSSTNIIAQSIRHAAFYWFYYSHIARTSNIYIFFCVCSRPFNVQRRRREKGNSRTVRSSFNWWQFIVAAKSQHTALKRIYAPFGFRVCSFQSLFPMYCVGCTVFWAMIVSFVHIKLTVANSQKRHTMTDSWKAIAARRQPRARERLACTNTFESNEYAIFTQ